MPTRQFLLFLYVGTLYLTRCDANDTSVSRLHTNSTNDEEVTETQHATCRIATEEIVASARATVTRVLRGTCTAKMIDEKLAVLERNLSKELEEMKQLLYSVLERTGKYSTRTRKMRGHCGADKSVAPSPRQIEIDNFNNTIQRVSSVNGTSSIFLYYWQIDRFDEKLGSWRAARSERTSTFHVGPNGYAMYIKITPRYFPDGTVFVGVGLTRGRQDSSLPWPFRHKIRLEVLDHSPEQTRQDRRSRIWDPSTLCSEYFWGRPRFTGDADNPECVGLSIPRQALIPSTWSGYPSRSGRYLWYGAITIKLTVYL